jgi:3D-(3,5/4)-trihydroxycyclohexane-1,2-dione acylhydrolase (decyclizing)
VTTVRLTASQALVQFLCAQQTQLNGETVPLVAGVWAIFGHGNVAGLGDALGQARDSLPTYRAHNEQAMAHAAIGYAKAHNRRRMMACTTSIGPGATNMVTAAALAHVNRLPLLLLPGDTFCSRAPDPVLQQLERFDDPTVTANDAFRCVSRYWDRITRPEQLLTSLPRAMQVLTDPVECGPVTLALPQDVQTEAYDFPLSFFTPRVHRIRRAGIDVDELSAVIAIMRGAQKPLIIAGGGVHYSGACEQLAEFSAKYRIPVAETQAGKSALAWDHSCNVGAIGVTGSSAANELASEADVVLCVGTRLQDFTTASRSLFANPECRLVGLNVAPFDAEKHGALALVGDALIGLQALAEGLEGWSADQRWPKLAGEKMTQWNQVVDRVTAVSDVSLPSDAQVLGMVNRAAGGDAVVVCAAGGLPGELHKLWRSEQPNGYHVEYGYSCMGYEIAGGLGVKMAMPEREVYVLVGDGSYLMMNSEVATSIMLDQKLILVILDNRGFACINRLQRGCGGESFNNLLRDSRSGQSGPPAVDFAAHAAALGATSEKVSNLEELQKALARAAQATATYAIVIETDPMVSTAEGGAWWEVAVAEVSSRPEAQSARVTYLSDKKNQRRS